MQARDGPYGFISLKKIEKLLFLKSSAFLIILAIQGTSEMPLTKGYKLIPCAQRHAVALPGFSAHMQR